jgi:cofilin
MASTGVTVADDVITQFNDMKLNRLKAKYIIYKIDGPSIVSDVIGESADWADFIKDIPADDCRYALYDMDFTSGDDRAMNKLVMISWVPDTAKVKAKMLYAGSKEGLNRAFDGVGTKVHATDMSELTKEAVVDACKKFS